MTNQEPSQHSNSRPSPSAPHTVLVTGGTSGIGAAVSLAFRKTGARVIAAASSPEELDAARQDPLWRGIEIESLDVTQPASVQSLLSRLPKLDALVCSAGITLKANEFSEEGFSRVLDVNLHGSFRVISAAMPALSLQSGCVVLVGSVLSFLGSGRLPAYTASKGAIRSLAQSLACRYPETGVRVNAVAPGWTETPLSWTGRQSADFSQTIVERTPMGRWAQPAEIADPILFLCSYAARYINGVCLPVDGGYTAAGN